MMSSYLLSSYIPIFPAFKMSIPGGKNSPIYSVSKRHFWQSNRPRLHFSALNGHECARSAEGHACGKRDNGNPTNGGDAIATFETFETSGGYIILSFEHVGKHIHPRKFQ
jgi:hypothetical protein